MLTAKAQYRRVQCSVLSLSNKWSTPASAASCTGSAAKPRPLVDGALAHALAGGKELCHCVSCTQRKKVSGVLESVRRLMYQQLVLQRQHGNSCSLL